MTARVFAVLAVDDILPNPKLLEARLTRNIPTPSPPRMVRTLLICAGGDCDIVLPDVMIPGMNGFEVCRRLKAEARLRRPR